MTTRTRVEGGVSVRSRALVIGYGNPLRCDDAVGWLVAATLLGDPRAGDLKVIAAHQLNPEHAVEMAEARRVVLVDAELEGSPPPPPGSWVVRRLDDTRRRISLPRPAVGWSHYCTPALLAALTVGLYGSVAPIYLVGVGVASMEPGEYPTPSVAEAVPALVDVVLDLARGGPRA